jgi:outer membrane usher protein
MGIMGLKLGRSGNSTNGRVSSVLLASTCLSLCLLVSPTIALADQAADMQALFLKAFGTKKKAVPSQFTVDLMIDGQKHDAVMVFNSKQQVVNRVKSVDVIPQLKTILKEDVFIALEKALGDTKEVSFAWLAEHNIKAAYDTAALSLNLKLDPEQREPLILSLLQDISSSVRKDNKIEASNVSGYLNLYTNTELTFQDGENYSDLQLQLDGNLTVNKVTLESQLTKSDDDWSLSNTYLTYDEPHNLIRYRLGDVRGIQRNFQQGVTLTGLSISKDFSLDRSQESQPVASEKLILTTRSDVIVLLNNFQIERYTLAAGTYQLEDIGLTDGHNDITLKIIDSFGKETIKESSQLFDNRLLKPKLSKYSVATGALSNDSDKFVASGIYQYGLTETITVGADAQLVGDQLLLGADVLSAHELGSLHMGTAISHTSAGGMGTALSATFKSNVMSKQKQVRWELGGELHSKGFSAALSLDDVTLEDSDSLRTSFYYKASKVLQKKWNTALGLNHVNYYDGSNDLTVDLSTSRRFGKGNSVSFGLNYADDTDWSVKTQLSIALGGKTSRRKRMGVLANSKDNSLETRYEVKALNSIGKDSLAGNLIYRKKGSSVEQKVEGSLKMQKFESHFSASHASTGSTDQQSVQVGINTSLACAGSECAVTYPIDNSFALVGGPRNQKQAIALNTGNRRFVYADDEDSILPVTYSALIPSAGKKAVIHLDDYERQRISVDEISLPFGYDPEKTEFEAFSGFHHGFSFNVGGEPGTVVDGILVDVTGKPLGFKGGQWISTKNKDKAIAFFSNKSGRFRVPSVASGSYILELHDYPDMEEVEVKISIQEEGIQDLGKVTIHL